MSDHADSSEHPIDAPPELPDLPPVELPSASFVVQLFLIPAAVVVVVIAVWLLFGKLAGGERDAMEYVRRIRSSAGSWRSAYELASLLQNDAKLGNDARLLGELTDLLDEELDQSADPRLAQYLAAALGTFQTLDAKLARTMEPRAAAPPKRLEALRQLARAGVPVSVMVAPIIPAVTDSEIERILDAAAAAGVKEAGFVMLRLPLEVRDLFREWLAANYPDRVEHVFRLIREMRGGKDYDSTWGTRMKGAGPYAWMIGRRFEIACERLGLNTARRILTTEHFQPPFKGAGQLSLF